MKTPRLVSRRTLLAATGVLCVVAGCGAPGRRLGEEVRIESVPPPTAADPDYCAVAALESLLRYWGEPVTSDWVAERVFQADQSGTSIPAILRLLNELGFDATLKRGTLDDVRAEIRGQRPALLFLKVAHPAVLHFKRVGPPLLKPVLDQAPRRAHVVLAVGFHKNDRYVLCHSNDQANVLFETAVLDDAWRRADRTMIVVRPKRSEGEG